MEQETPKRWEIWHARFNFDNNAGYKYRPVLILVAKESVYIAAMITRSDNKLCLMHDYILEDWKEAGLVKPSIVRMDRISELRMEYIGTSRRIGKLTKRDSFALSVVINRLYPVLSNYE